MTRDEVLRRISNHRDEIASMGVTSLELFGSTVRGDAKAASDIDLLVEFDTTPTLFTIYGLEEYLEHLFAPHRVDLVLRRSVIEEFRDEIYSEAVPCL